MIEEDSLVTFTEFSNDDINHMCRVCLQDGVLKSVFADDEVPKLSQKINECASVQVQKGDGLPENICDYCISELNLAYYFRNQCRLSDAKLRRAFQKNKHNEEEIITGDLINISNNNETTILNHEQVPVPMQIDPLLPSVPPKIEPISEPIITPPPEVFPIHSVVDNSHLEIIFQGEKNDSLNNHRQPVVTLNCLPPQEQTINIECPAKPKIEVEDEEKYLKNNVKNKFKCDECGKIFLYFSRLKQHQATHSTNRPFKCEVCEKSFCRKDTLNIHMNTHTNVKPFKCDQCVANFKRRNSLNKHYYIHTNIKKYKCEICFKLFGRRDNYNVHMKSLHSGIKSFKCELCPKAFVRSDVYSRHKKTHEQFTKKYICAICLKTYSRADVLRAHLKQHVKKFENQQ